MAAGRWPAAMLRRREEDRALANNLAYGALIAWPVISLILFMMMPASRALIWTVLAGYLLLPTYIGFDAPGIPPLDKTSIPNLAALVLAPLMARSGEFRWPRSMTVNLLMAGHVLMPLATTLTNGNPIVIGTVTIPGLTLMDGLSGIVGRVIELIPFALGASLLGHERGHRQMLMAFMIAGLAYALPVLLEVRLSPFLQTAVYGIVNVDYFIQQIRDGGFRAMVFLGHGLLVSTFIAMTIIASIGLARMRVRVLGMPAWVAALFLSGVLLLNKSLSATALVVVIGGLLVLLTPRRFVTVAFAAALLIVTYPMVRSSGLIPYQSLVSAAGTISSDRAASLDFRLRNEEILLNRAKERPLFGWGGYGRNRVFVVSAQGITSDASVTDGTWVVVIGSFGWLGYITYFGLLTYPIWHAFRLRARGLPVATAALAAMHLLNLLDLIPNSSLRPLTWLTAGALVSLMLAGQRAPVARRSAGGGPANAPAVAS
jgi:hypothetical protein